MKRIRDFRSWAVLYYCGQQKNLRLEKETRMCVPYVYMVILVDGRLPFNEAAANDDSAPPRE